LKKQPLTKEAILAASMALIQKEGFDALSFRKLATALKVTPMAIYRHFDNKNDLLAGLLDQFITKAQVLPKNGHAPTWQDWVYLSSQNMYLALSNEPGWLPLLGQVPLKASALTVLDEFVKTLTSNGFTREQASQAFIAILQMLFGAALMKQQIKLNALEVNNEQSLSMDMIQAFSQDPFETGIRLIIAGLEKTLVN